MVSPTQDPMHWGGLAPEILMGLAEIQAENAHTRKLPPVETWNPPYCGELDIRIAVDGTWFYLGSPIGRPGLVRLFSTILRRDADGRHYLVTPVEKVGIQVDDAPFLAVRVDCEGDGVSQVLKFMTNVGDRVIAGPEHALHVDYTRAEHEPRPYLEIRQGLKALVSRSVFYELVGMAEEVISNGKAILRVSSAGVQFSLGQVDP